MRNKLVDIDHTEQADKRSLRPGFDSAMFTETSHVLQHEMFQKSPTMTRLLVWLLHETIAGRGDTVKSYTIAVEALGRAEGFDSQMDSYPRVQTGRLRKALEAYYAQRGPVHEQCIYLQPGSYRLRFAKLDRAYPQLYRPLSQDVPSVGAEANFEDAVELSSSSTVKMSGSRKLLYLLLGLLACASVPIVIYLSMA